MASAVGPPSGSALAPQAVSGRGRSRALAAGARGGGGGGWAASVPPSYAARPRRRPGDVRPASPPRGAPTRASGGPCPPPPPRLAVSGRASRAEAESCVRGRAPGMRAPAATRGTPRRRLPPRASPRAAAAPLRASCTLPETAGRRWAPVGGGRGRTASSVARRGGAVSAAARRLCGVGGVEGWGDGDGGRAGEKRERVWEMVVGRGREGPAVGGRPPGFLPHRLAFHARPRRSLLSAPPPPLPSPPPPPPSSPVLPSVTTPPPQRARCRASPGHHPPRSPPRPSVRPSRGRRLVLPSRPSRAFLSPPRARAGEGSRWWGAGRPRLGRGVSLSLSPLPARPLARARARAGALRDATSDQTWRPAEFKHISQRRKRN